MSLIIQPSVCLRHGPTKIYHGVYGHRALVMCWWICVAWCYIIWVGNWVINEVSDLILCACDWFFKVGGLKYTRFTVIFVSRTVLTTSVSQSLWWCLCIAPEQPSFFCKESIHWVLVVYISEIWTWHLVHIYFSLRIVYSVNFRMATWVVHASLGDILAFLCSIRDGFTRCVCSI